MPDEPGVRVIFVPPRVHAPTLRTPARPLIEALETTLDAGGETAFGKAWSERQATAATSAGQRGPG
eukprot:scaffold4405_cov31-Tisochrysis_lutea.AAC.7